MKKTGRSKMVKCKKYVNRSATSYKKAVTEIILSIDWGGEHTPGIRRDGHLLFEVEMYLQKGCIMVSGVGSS